MLEGRWTIVSSSQQIPGLEAAGEVDGDSNVVGTVGRMGWIDKMSLTSFVDLSDLGTD